MNPTEPTPQATMEKVKELKNLIALAENADDGDEVMFIDLDEKGRKNLGEIAQLCETLYKDLQIAGEALEEAKNNCSDYGCQDDCENVLQKLSTYQQGR